MKILKISTIALVAILSFTACNDTDKKDILSNQVIKNNFRNENIYQKRDDYSFALLNQNKEKIKIYEQILSDTEISNVKKGVKQIKTKLNTILKSATESQQGKQQLRYFLNNVNRLKRWKYIDSDFVPAAKKILGK